MPVQFQNGLARQELTQINLLSMSSSSPGAPRTLFAIEAVWKHPMIKGKYKNHISQSLTFRLLKAWNTSRALSESLSPCLILTGANSGCTKTKFMLWVVYITRTAAYPTSAGTGCQLAPEDAALSLYIYFSILLIMLCCGQQNQKQAGVQLWWLAWSFYEIWVKPFATSDGRKKKDGLMAQAVECCFKELGLPLLLFSVRCQINETELVTRVH